MRTKNEKPEQKKQEKKYRIMSRKQIVCQIRPAWNLQLPWIRHKP